jgi:hypothetical protein
MAKPRNPPPTPTSDKPTRSTESDDTSSSDETDNGEDAQAAVEPGGYACKATQGHVGLDFLGDDVPVSDAAPVDGSVELIGDEEHTSFEGELTWGWKQEGEKFRFVWVERGTLRTSDVVSDTPSTLRAASPDGMRFLTALEGDTVVWAIDRATGKGARVIHMGDEIIGLLEAAHGRVIALSASACRVLVENRGRWEAEHDGPHVLRIAAAAKGRVLAVVWMNEPELRVWASTSRGLVEVSRLEVPVLDASSSGDRLVVTVDDDSSYEVTNLEAAADAAERDAKGKRYRLVDFIEAEPDDAAEPRPTDGPKIRKGERGRFAREASDITVGLEPCRGRPAVTYEPSPFKALFGESEHVYFDGEHTWGWKPRKAGYVFGWVDGGKLCASKLTSDDPSPTEFAMGVKSCRRGDGKAYLVLSDPQSVWEVRTDTGEPTKVFSGRNVRDVAYCGPDHVWIFTGSFIEVFERKGRRFNVVDQSQRIGIAAVGNACASRALLFTAIFQGAVYLVVPTSVGPMLADELELSPITVFVSRDQVFFQCDDADGDPEFYEVTHLEEMVAHVESADLGAYSPFEFTDPGPYTAEYMIEVEAGGEEG